MHMTKLGLPTIAISAITLTLGVLPAYGQGKSEAPAPPDSVEAQAMLDVETAGVRANQLAEQRGGLGAYYDAATRQHVVVMSPGASLSSAEASRDVGASARVETRDITKAAVDSFQARVAGKAFHADAGKYTYASYVDLPSGKMVLDSDAPAAVTASLSKSAPGGIVRRTNGVSDTSRQSDTAPFWGGASIKSGGAVCTAGFVVMKPTGRRFMLTAAHCFPLFATVLTRGNNLIVGVVRQRGPIPPYDMELIADRSYAGRIYTGGTNSTTSKPVVSAGDPVVGVTGYCHSGQTTGENCGHKIISVSAQVCTQTGCKSPVIAWQQGTLIQGGDSGSPFYYPTSTGVRARGINIASGGSTAYAEKWSRISSHLGVSIVTG